MTQAVIMNVYASSYFPHTNNIIYNKIYISSYIFYLYGSFCKLGNWDRSIYIDIYKAWIKKNANFKYFVFVISELKLHPILKILVSTP